MDVLVPVLHEPEGGLILLVYMSATCRVCPVLYSIDDLGGAGDEN